MRIRQDEPFEVQPRANAALASALRGAGLTAFVCGIIGFAVPGVVGTVAAWSAVGVIIAAPLARVGLLGIRWIARRDFLFAILAFALLGVVASGAVLALVLAG